MIIKLLSEIATVPKSNNLYDFEFTISNRVTSKDTYVHEGLAFPFGLLDLLDLYFQKFLLFLGLLFHLFAFILGNFLILSNDALLLGLDNI